MTVHHYFNKDINISSSAVAKTIKSYDETGCHEDRHRNGRPRVTSPAEDKLIWVTSLRNSSPNKCFRVQVTDTSQHQLFRGDCESGLHGLIVANKPPLKDTNKKRLAWVKKHDKSTLDGWKFVLWSDESKFDIFDSNRHVFVRRGVGERMISACVFSPDTPIHHPIWFGLSETIICFTTGQWLFRLCKDCLTNN